MLPLADVARKLELTPDDLVPYGRDKAKVPLDLLDRPGRAGRLVLVSAITPTPAGEGKTTTTIGLVQALERLGHRAAAALREPSLGPCFGVKGGGTGGGRARLEPSVDIDLHFTGDLHAVGAAHNLLAALADNHLHFGGSPALDARQVSWPRVLDVNDRALRRIVLGLGASGGVPREGSFDITAASEVMAVLCLAEGAEDLRARLGRLVVGDGPDGTPVTAEDLGAAGAMTALLRDALLPNLVQTTEGTPAFVHGGPFANIAHGCNSVLATRMALHTADWVVTEAGFGFDLGGEKFLDIKCAGAGLSVDAIVLVATVRALKWHGGVAVRELAGADPAAVERGLENLEAHVDNARAFGGTPVVALNRFEDDADDEIVVVRRRCEALGVPFAVSDHFSRGGEGAEALARAVVEHASGGFRPLVDRDALALDKIRTLARLYGARDVVVSHGALRDLARAKRNGWNRLPVCMAKTWSSLSDDPGRRGRPRGFDLHVREVRPAPGAGFLVVLTGDIVRMPGLPRRPQALDVDLVDGEVVGVG